MRQSQILLHHFCQNSWVSELSHYIKDSRKNLVYCSESVDIGPCSKTRKPEFTRYLHRYTYVSNFAMNLTNIFLFAWERVGAVRSLAKNTSFTLVLLRYIHSVYCKNSLEFVKTTKYTTVYG